MEQAPPKASSPQSDPSPSLLGLNQRFLFNSKRIADEEKYKNISLYPLDNNVPTWYNKTISPLEPGESYLLLIENRIPNNRYVPVVACAGRATWLMQPDRRIATGGCAMTDSGVNDTSVRSHWSTQEGVRRPWRQPATVRLLWLHTGSGRHGKTVGEDNYQVRPDGHGKPCVQHINIQVRSTNTAERERVFSKGHFTKG